MDILALLSNKGGTSKTTTSVNLAAIFSERSRVLLVDADPTKSASWWLDRGEQSFTYAASTNPAEIKKLKGVDFDYVFIDCAPQTRTVLFDAVLSVTDAVILPCTAAPMDVHQGIQLARSLKVKHRLLIARTDPRSTREAEDLIAALRKAKLPVFSTYIRTYVAHQRANYSGKPVTKYAGAYAEEAAGDYIKLASEVKRWLKN